MLNQLIVATAMPFACPERRREAALGLATLLAVSEFQKPLPAVPPSKYAIVALWIIVIAICALLIAATGAAFFRAGAGAKRFC
jgi:hypothetical protein